MTAPVKRMSGARLKVELGALGLPPSWLAEHCNVTMRTVVRWCDGEAVPASVAAEIEVLSQQALLEMRQITSAAEDAVKGAGDKAHRVVLHTCRTDGQSPDHYPASWHRQLTFRVLEQLEAQGHDVVVEYA